MSKIPLEKLAGSFISYPEEANFSIEEVPARSLLDYRRFDFCAKLLYIDHYVKGLDLSYAKEVYTAQVTAITAGTNKEKGNENKNSVDAFINAFNQLISDIKNNGFDSNKSLIPVDSTGYVMDGAHRLSCAAYFDQTVTIIKFKDWTVNYQTDWAFLKDNFLEEKYLDAMALEYCNWHQNLYMACLWPRSFSLPDEKKKADDYIAQKTNIVYRKKVQLDSKALHNFLLQIYSHMEWIGNVENQFAGVDAKIQEVYYKGLDSVEFYLLQADSYQTVFDMKQEVRKIYNVGLSSIHITDNIRETRQIADLIYNPNSLYHLKHATPDKYAKSFNNMLLFRNILKDNHLDWHNYVIDSSMSMAIFGIREAGDLDFLTTDGDEKKELIKNISHCILECNDKYLSLHKHDLKDLIFIPSNYFVFFEMKFLTLPNVAFFKRKKGENKDKNDVKLISAFLSDNFFNRLLSRLLRLRYVFSIKKRMYKNKIQKGLIFSLKKIGLYNAARNIYHKISRRS